MNLKKIIIITLILGALSLYIFAFNMKASESLNYQLLNYDASEFTEANELTNTEKLVASNDDFELYIDETTSYFKVLDLRNGEIYASNPSVEDPWAADPTKLLTPSAVEKQKSTLEIQYFNKSGSLATINNYGLSIYHPESILNDKGDRTFSIKYIEDGVQIKYAIEDLEIDYLYFPKYLPKDVFEAFDQFDVLSRIAYTGYNENTELYELVQYESMSRLVKKRLYQVFYEEMEYTRERSIEENMLYGYFEQFEKVRFEIAIELKLTDEGLKTTIIRDSIVEPENVKIAKISLYPLFGTAISEIAGVETEGYIVLPDGSGAIIEFNNGKYFQNAYNKRLYSKDIALLPFEMSEQQQKITMPVYGMIKENGGFAAIITEGDAMAWITADVSGRIDSYNKVFTQFSMREVESVIIGSGFNRYGVDLWTQDIVNSDFTVLYHFLEGSDNNYAGVAKAYKKYLIDSFGFEDQDQTNSTVLTTEFIGAYDRKEFFLGIPYHTVESMTTFDQAEEIISQLHDRDIDLMNVVYQGTINGGLAQSLNDRVNFEKVLGGKKGYNDLKEALDLLGIDVYQVINLMTAKEYNKAFDQFRYTASRINGDHSLMFNYHYPSKLPYSETPYEHSKDAYVINPLYYETIFNKLNKDYAFDHLAFSYFGSMIAGSYHENQIIYKQDAIDYQVKLLDEVEQSMMFINPLSYAFSYAKYIIDLPVEATLYSIIDYQIPLLQLVLSEYVDYTSNSLNLPNDRSVDYQFLKLIETGSNIKYTLTYDDSRELLNTEYNYFMSTHYENWLDIIEAQVKELDQLGIHQGYLVNHERVANNVYRVTYSNGLKVIINYNLSPVIVDSITVPSVGYIVEEV